MNEVYLCMDCLFVNETLIGNRHGEKDYTVEKFRTTKIKFLTSHTMILKSILNEI